jgi:hypothetical protein
MDELISKRAVIEAIEKARANVGHNLERSIGKSIIEILDDVGRDVDRLPSALGTNLAEVGTDLISRQQAIDDIWTVSPLARLDRKWVDRWLRQLPPIQPKRGRWISADAIFGGVPFYCSECGENTRDTTVMGKPRWNFCPNCGAKMEVTK